MNQPTPAIVAQSAVRRLPRMALLLLCAAYVLPGFIGRQPWRTADLAALGFMQELAQGRHGWAAWLNPQMLGQPPDVPALLPYWLGAWAMQLAPSGVSPDWVARLPFMALLVLTLTCTWYAAYHLSRSPGAQPVAFAFGGEALPQDYARAMADGALLALLASLGLAHLSHETTPALAQLGFFSLMLYAFAAAPYRRVLPACAAMVGMVGLTLSGAPVIAVLAGAGAALLSMLEPAPSMDSATASSTLPSRRLLTSLGIVVLTVACTLLATLLQLWRWQIELPRARLAEWYSLGRLFLWFTWPAWSLTLWTLWRWRKQWFSLHPQRHLALPILFSGLAVVATLTLPGARDRALLLALPALAALAAFALPTLKRSVAALIDWFTLLFFSTCALTIWVIWLSMQTGFPKQPAANVARMWPDFVPSFSWLALVLAVLATWAWIGIVRWRVGRHRAAIWKSLALPAGGAALCWMLLTTLWLPLLNHALGAELLVQGVVRVIEQRSSAPASPADLAGSCVQVAGLSNSQVAALRIHSTLNLKAAAASNNDCPWLVFNPAAGPGRAAAVDLRHWQLMETVRGTRGAEPLDVYRRSVPH